ncbi:AAA family ATPase [Xanthobacteraceae bacterium A53D]
MLYRLEIENFYSIRDLQVLDLTVDGRLGDDDGRFSPIFEGAGAYAPNVVALYGANGSGKSTVLNALIFLIRMIRESAQLEPGRFWQCERFNDAQSASRSIRLALEIGGAMNLTPEIQENVLEGREVIWGIYRYELELEVNKGTVTRIGHEALRQKPGGVGRWQRVFERASGQVKDSTSFSTRGYSHLVKTLAENHTVISSFAKFNHPVAKLFVEAAQKAYFTAAPAHSFLDQSVIDYLRKEPGVVSRLGDELSRIDVGVEGIRFQETPEGSVLFFKHSGLELEMPWALESYGTRSFIKMYPFIIYALEAGGVAIIDEMDSAIHPLILPEILRWFYDANGRNRDNAQLWLSCHSASLLEELRKEQIVICEKDREGRTHLVSLADMKVRRDENHARKYLGGAYGGVPQIG